MRNTFWINVIPNPPDYFCDWSEAPIMCDLCQWREVENRGDLCDQCAVENAMSCGDWDDTSIAAGKRLHVFLPSTITSQHPRP